MYLTVVQWRWLRHNPGYSWACCHPLTPVTDADGNYDGDDELRFLTTYACCTNCWGEPDLLVFKQAGDPLGVCIASHSLAPPIPLHKRT